MQYFLVKTDPSDYSIEDFQIEKVTVWDGVRNPTAVKTLKAMQAKDKVLIYHSQGESSIVGLAEVVIGTSRPDPKDPKSWLVDLKLLQTYPEPRITLQQIKQTHQFDDLALVRQGRLSTMPIPEKFIDWLRQLSLSI